MKTEDILKIADTRAQYRKLYTIYNQIYDPSNPEQPGAYPWQVKFHNAGADYPQRALFAANQVGKTSCAAAEVACHLTGLYPPWWKGKKFTKGVKFWVGSETNQSSRDITQQALLGPVGQFGTGWIPADKIIGKPKMKQAGVPDVVDTFYVEHSSGGISECGFKTYDQERSMWQGTRKDGVWFDEEPKEELYSEGLTRTIAAKGIVLLTFTPLKGWSEVVRKYIEAKPDAGMYVQTATWEDAPHLDEATKNMILNSYSPHERDARTKGTPMLGQGAIFPIGDEEISCAPFPIPDHFYRINGVDFGIGHPAAGVFLAHDRDSDTVYVYDCYRARGETPIYHAAAMRKHGDWIPNSWPQDGLARDKGSGDALWGLYRKAGLYMLREPAHYPDERGNHTEPGLIELYEYMRTGKFKVFTTLTEWFEEKNMYHREVKNAQSVVVKERDDIMSATRYAFMMRRFALTKPKVAVNQKVLLPMLGGQL